jgi:hypothetical protein
LGQASPSSAQLKRLLVGMVLLTLGQLLVAQGPEFVTALRPLDWSHWLLLLGAMTLTWRLTDIQVGGWGRLGCVATVAGAAAFVGMCVIDFILWTFPSDPARQAFASQVLRSPAISLPFLTAGPSLLFVGLGILALEWVALMRWRTGLVLGGIAAVGFGQFGNTRWLVVAGHVTILAGFCAMWLLARTARSHSMRSFG